MSAGKLNQLSKLGLAGVNAVYGLGDRAEITSIAAKRGRWVELLG